MNQRAQQKLSQIQELIKQKEIIEKELESLLSEKAVILPLGFSLNNEVLDLIKENINGIASTQILNTLLNKYPDYGIDRKKVASSLAYLKNTKKLIGQAGRGIYKLAENKIG
ncbi:MAG: hypothetical protein AAB501_01005 [Patescibacteria group bacterium]